MKRSIGLALGLLLALWMGTVASVSAQGLNVGGGIPISGTIDSDQELYVTADVEVGGFLYLSNHLFMQGYNGTGLDFDQDIWFYDDGERTRNYLRWDDVRSDAVCSGTTATSSAFVWHLNDNSDSAFLMTNGATGGVDVEFKLDDLGNLAIDGSLVQSGSCDLAETFLGADLEPGTVVAVDPGVREGVVASSEAYQATVVGVVSTQPGLLLNGPTAGFYAYAAEMESVQTRLADNPHDEALAFRKNELEAMRDAWQRGNLPVALVGRVPVRVDGSFGAIRTGDALTSSPNPGHAMVMSKAGPMLGVALDDLAGGTGSILVLLRTGWHVPGGVKLAASALPQQALPGELLAKLDELATENRALRQQVAHQASRAARNHQVLAELLTRLRGVEEAVLTLSVDRSAALEPAESTPFPSDVASPSVWPVRGGQ